MEKLIFGERTSAPAYFDLIVQHPVNNCSGFQRVGDRAAAYIKCLEWRQANPDRKLIILDMPNAHNETLSTLIAKECPAEWVFGDVADEIWLVTEPDEILPKPDAEGLYTELMWKWWHDFNERKGNLTLQLSKKPTKEAFEFVDLLKDRWKLPNRYATIQPLFDAPYADYRNKPISYWKQLISDLNMPLVILGHHRNSLLMGTPPGVYSGWSAGMNIMESLAMIHGASLHIGGETGTTIWASIFGVDVYGIYGAVKHEDTWLAEPISFGGRVCVNMIGEPKFTAQDIHRFWSDA